MHDDRRDGISGSGATSEPADRDTLGALISAAGKRPAPPDGAYEQVFAAAHDSWRRRLRLRAQRRWTYALAATLAAVAVGVAFVLGLMPGTSAPVIATAGVIQGDVRVLAPDEDRWRQLNRASGPIVAGSTLRATPTGRVALTLPGDISLRVDAATELVVLAAREIDLTSGTIYIDSGADSTDDAVRVTTPLGAVTDVGTQFEVAASDTALRVRIRNGAVRVEAGDADGEVLGSAGEQVSLGVDGNVERDIFSPFDADWAWVETLADPPAVEGQSLMAFLDWVARETGRELRFDAPVTETRARTVVLHGTAANLSPMRALEVMLSTTDFDYRLRNDGAIVISPRAR